MIFIVVCLGARALGATVTTPEIEDWYKIIEKVSWNPPDSVFVPVWTGLFVMMAIAATTVALSLLEERGLADGSVPYGCDDGCSIP